MQAVLSKIAVDSEGRSRERFSPFRFQLEAREQRENPFDLSLQTKRLLTGRMPFWLVCHRLVFQLLVYRAPSADAFPEPSNKVQALVNGPMFGSIPERLGSRQPEPYRAAHQEATLYQTAFTHFQSDR